LEETILRRALRLEPDERAPRFDAAALAVAATAHRRPVVAVVGGLAALAATAAITYTVWSAIAAAAPTLFDASFDALLSLVAGSAVPIAAILAVAQEPAVPTSVLAATLFAVFYELRHRKETAHAVAS
jgi:hypothetical protein